MLRDEHAPFYLQAATDAGGRQEKVSYPWLFFHPRRPFVLGLLTTCSVGAGASLLFLWYVRTGQDASARSPFGVGYGVIGTVFLVASAVGFSMRRRLRTTRRVGQLNGALQWHIFLSVLGLLFLALHSFGHLQHQSGAAALLCLLALSLSGVVGKVLDHVVPRLLAREVARALTEQGENVTTAVSRHIAASQAQSTREMGRRGEANVLQYAVQGSTKALQRERLYRVILRSWRRVHIVLAVITIAITCWHIAYAIQVLFGR